MVSTAAPIGLLLVDDHRQFLEVLEAILASEPDLTIVGRAANGEDAVAAVGPTRPDVVLMDISMPVLNGFEATRQIRAEHPDLPVIMLTGSSSEEDRAAAQEAGAVGYVTKERVLDDLARAVRAAAEGRRLS
jgi:DNA-binding NarL/FixJ family response regulator